MEVDDSEIPFDLFEEAAAHLKLLMSTIHENDLLHLYALYKQATAGVCSTNKPGIFEIQRRKKWLAWSSLGNMTRSQAKLEYIGKIQSHDPSWDPLNNSTPAFGIKVSRMTAKYEEVKEKTIYDFCREGSTKKLAEAFTSDDVSLTDDNGRTLLHWACDRGHVDIVVFLLNKTCDVNAQDSDGLTPLHYSVQCDYREITKILLNWGADCNLEDTDGESALDSVDLDEMKQFLLENSLHNLTVS